MTGIEKKRYDSEGYAPVVDFESWRVELLNATPEYVAESIATAQRHTLTDEVFVLLKGSCVLLAFGEADAPGACEAVAMETGTIYNVRQNVWHSHVLAPGSKVLVVENRDTTVENSPVMPVDEAGRGEIIALCQKLL